jgi:hypothetical protein
MKQGHILTLDFFHNRYWYLEKTALAQFAVLETASVKWQATIMVDILNLIKD